MVTSFVLIAAFTPALALLTHQQVSMTEDQTRQSIDQSLEVINASKKIVSSSDAILQNLNNIEVHLKNNENAEAIVDTRKLEENYQEYSNATRNIQSVLSGTESGEKLSEELTVLDEAEDILEERIVYTSQSARTGSTISQEMINELKSEFQDVASASATINAVVIETESDSLLNTQRQLSELSGSIVYLGGIIVLLAFAFAGVASFRLSQPIRELSEEAEKIKNEKFKEVDLGDITPMTDEVRDLKDVLGETVLAMKAEFERDRSEMNQLAIDIADKLAKEIPRSTAESSLISSCGNIGCEPKELTEGDIDDLVDDLQMNTAGLDISDDIFEEIRDMK